MGTAGIPVLYQTAVAEVTCRDSHPDHTSPSSPLSAKGCRVIHQRFQSRQSPTFRDGPFVWSDEAVLVDTVESKRVMICTGLLIWHSAHNSSMQQSYYRQPQPSFASATIAALALSFVWPNPSAACVDDFAVRGSGKGLRRLETVMPRPAVKESAPEASDSTTADHWL